MEFYKIRYLIQDKYLQDGKTRGASRVIGAKDEAMALRIAEADLEKDGWEIIELLSCEEITPTYVKVSQVGYFI